MKSTIKWMIVLTAMLFASPSGADVLTLSNGKVMKGIVEDDPSDKAFVKFLGSGGTIKVPRDRIKNTQKESKAQGYTHIGDEFRAQKKNQEALEKYKQALKEDAGFGPAKEGVKLIEASLAGEKKAMRKDAISEIDNLKDEIHKAIHDADFNKAEELLKTSSSLVPTEQQKAGLQQLVCDLYLAWAKDRMDKFDRAGAEQKLNLSLAACPENDEVIEMLLNLWEGQNDKQDQILQIYETVLNRRPDDQPMRRKLADLYSKAGRLEDSARHYLILYKNSENKYKGSPLEELLKENLQRLHAQFAQNKDLDKAIYYVKLLAAIDPETDPSTLTYYEYLKRANAVAKDDVNGRLELADWCEQNALDQEALTHYRLVKGQDPNNDQAKAAIDRYALNLVSQAQQAFNDRNFFLAKAVADQITREFEDSDEAQVRAKELMTASNNEIAKAVQGDCEEAQKFVEAGDSYLQQAMVFYDRIFNKEYQNSSIKISNPKSDARRYFQYAVQSYHEAVKKCPKLKDEAGGLIQARMKEAQNYLSRLTSGPPPSRKNMGRIIGPENDNPIRNDPEGRRR
ncbi:hypothetical protein HY256_07135 [Candidatus Sumerlaeota bacterium]|nr:hypothetical protein [Candidatus Sumerlaeota bacterium]